MSGDGAQYAGEVEFLEVMITSPDGNTTRLDANNDIVITPSTTPTVNPIMNINSLLIFYPLL